MLWRLSLVAAVAVAVVHGAILPEKFANAVKTSTADPVIEDQDLWTEYGLKESELAGYGRFRVTAHQFKDSTGAFAALQWLQGERDDLSMLVLHNNYVLGIEGARPSRRHLEEVFEKLPGLTDQPLPTLNAYVPQQGLEKESQRYILGPASLTRFEPRIPLSTAAFEYNAEGQVAKYRGGLTLALFSYPTPHIARERLTHWEKVPGVTVKRSGTLIVAVLGSNLPQATKLIDSINYKASLTVSETVGKQTSASDVANMMLSIFSLAGVLLVLCIAGGLAMAAIRIGMRRFGRGQNDDPIIMLHLE